MMMVMMMAMMTMMIVMMMMIIMMLYDVKAVDFIAELCVLQLNAKLKPSYIPRCGIFEVRFTYTKID